MISARRHRHEVCVRRRHICLAARIVPPPHDRTVRLQPQRVNQTRRDRIVRNRIGTTDLPRQVNCVRPRQRDVATVRLDDDGLRTRRTGRRHGDPNPVVARILNHARHTTDHHICNRAEMAVGDHQRVPSSIRANVGGERETGAVQPEVIIRVRAVVDREAGRIERTDGRRAEHHREVTGCAGLNRQAPQRRHIEIRRTGAIVGRRRDLQLQSPCVGDGEDIRRDPAPEPRSENRAAHLDSRRLNIFVNEGIGLHRLAIRD